jgi:hypothetical protein
MVSVHVPTRHIGNYSCIVIVGQELIVDAGAMMSNGDNRRQFRSLLYGHNTNRLCCTLQPFQYRHKKCSHCGSRVLLLQARMRMMMTTRPYQGLGLGGSIAKGSHHYCGGPTWDNGHCSSRAFGGLLSELYRRSWNILSGAFGTLA